MLANLVAGLVVLPALEDVMHRRLRVGLYERGDLLRRSRPVLLAGRDRLLHPVAKGRIFGEPLREFVVTDFRFGVCLDECLLRGVRFKRLPEGRLDHTARRRVEFLSGCSSRNWSRSGSANAARPSFAALTCLSMSQFFRCASVSSLLVPTVTTRSLGFDHFSGM